MRILEKRVFDIKFVLEGNIFMSIFFINDITALQYDLDKFTLNTSKCVSISFNCSRSAINSQYYLCGNPL